MPFEDDLAEMIADAGDAITLDGRPTFGLVDLAGEVVLDGIVTTSAVAEVLASENAQPEQIVVHNSTSYLVRRVLPVPPDGALVQLVLAKV